MTCDVRCHINVISHHTSLMCDVAWREVCDCGTQWKQTQTNKQKHAQLPHVERTHYSTREGRRNQRAGVRQTALQFTHLATVINTSAPRGM